MMIIENEDTLGGGGDSDDDGGTSSSKVLKKMTQGKRKIDIKYITNKPKRHITFSKRKAGIMKKVSGGCERVSERKIWY